MRQRADEIQQETDEMQRKAGGTQGRPRQHPRRSEKKSPIHLLHRCHCRWLELSW